MKLKLKRGMISLLVAGMILSSAAQAVPRYSVTGLGYLDVGRTDATPTGINASGQVVGQFYSSGFNRVHAFLSIRECHDRPRYHRR